MSECASEAGDYSHHSLAAVKQAYSQSCGLTQHARVPNFPIKMDEFFIECVRQYPCLWDTKLISYKQLDVKDAAWKEILKKTNLESGKFFI